ncbi:MAG: acetate--CoA ligase family protein [FCB group bacterium]|jgi:acetyltransferase
MIVNELINPKSIVVIGASNDISKPGGRVLKNLIDGGFVGSLTAMNPKEKVIQGIKCINEVSELENTDIAIIAIASKYVAETIEYLTKNKGTKAFIVLSAGFSEIGDDGKKLENQLVEIVNKAGATLIGPNCMGIINQNYRGIFGGPMPKLDSKGIDFVSGSGATAVFILETAIQMGLTFSSVFTVGNSASIGVEEVLQYWDGNFDPITSSKNKIIYIEKIDKPGMLLKHSRSLIQKGCKIAAIKAGTTEAGSRAVSSHTGALAGSDTAVDALFRKAGIVRCYSKQELVYTAGVFAHKELKGNKIVVITHAGGPGVMLTDALSKGGMKVPHIEGPAAQELLSKLNYGSSVANPIDFIATGTAEQLGEILDYVDNKFDNIDASVVIFGTPGLFDIKPVYKVLDEKMRTCNKPIFPVLPSPVQAKEAIDYFISLGRIVFPDEVILGNTLAKIYNTPKPFAEPVLPQIDKKKIRQVIDNSIPGYLSPKEVQELLDAVSIPRAKEIIAKSKTEAVSAANELGYPIVMKVVGPIHKTDVGGIKLNITYSKSVEAEFDNLMKIKDATGVLIQPMLSGIELFVGAKAEPGFGHIILCGLGGIFIEVLKDVASGLSPIGKEEALHMLKSLKGYALLKGVRGQAGVDENKFADIIVRLSALLEAAPEIQELDINPLLGKADSIIAVDARIKI